MKHPSVHDSRSHGVERYLPRRIRITWQTKGALYPQAINEKKVDWLFPIILDVNRVFDKVCILSPNRSNGFTTRWLRPFETTFVPGTQNHLHSSTQLRNDTSSGHSILPDLGSKIPDGSTCPRGRNRTSNRYICLHIRRSELKQRRIMFGLKTGALPDGHPSKPEFLTNLG